MNTPIGTEIAAVTSAMQERPLDGVGGAATDAARGDAGLRVGPPRDSSSISAALERAWLPRIQTSGTTAMKNAAHMTTRARRSLVARGDDFEASSGCAGARLGGALERGVELHGAHSVKAFLRSMTMRATALTAKVSTNSTRPAAM